jgi:transposase
MLGTKSRALDCPDLVSLEALVPGNHLYRELDAQLDLSFVRAWVKDCYAERGRPSVDPIVFFKLQLVLDLEGLRSERQLMRLAADRLGIRWYIGYRRDEALPDHSTLTRIRERYGLEVFRRFFDAVVERCIEAGLVWGKEFYFDATKVQANASFDSIKPRFAVDEHLRNLFAESKEEVPAPDNGPAEHNQTEGSPPPQLHADAPAEPAEQNAARHDWMAEEGQPDRSVIRGSYRRLADYRMSTTDPDASTMRTAGRLLRLGYQDTYVTDGGRARIILNVLVTPGDVMENQVMPDLLWHTCFRWQLWPDQVAADTTYGTIENIISIEDAGITIYTPLPDWDKRTSYFGASLFTYDPETDTYRCPAEQTLRRDHAKYTEGKIVYLADSDICDACALRSQCTSSKEGRRIHRSIGEDYLAFPSPNRGVREGDAQAETVDRANVCGGEALARVTRVPVAATQASEHRGPDGRRCSEHQAATHVARTEVSAGLRDGRSLAGQRWDSASTRRDSRVDMLVSRLPRACHVLLPPLSFL